MHRLLSSFFVRSLCVVALLLAHAAFAQDREWVHYSKLVKTLWLDKFYGTPIAERDTLRVVVRVKSPGIDPVEVTIPAADAPIVLRFTGDSEVEFPYSEDLMRADPMMLTNVPADVKASASISVLPRLPLKKEYDAAELAKPVDQANTIIKKQLGVLSFALPKSKSIAFKFAPGVQATATVSGAENRVVAADEKGAVTIPIDDAMRKPGVHVTLSQLPVSMRMND